MKNRPDSVKKVDFLILIIVLALIAYVLFLVYIYNRPEPDYKYISEKRIKSLLNGCEVVATECVGDYCVSIVKYNNSLYSVTTDYPKTSIQKL